MSVEAPQTTRQVVEALLLDSGERRKLLRFARNWYGIPLDAAEDVLHDTAVQLLAQRQRVRKPRPYLYSVFRVRCRRYLGSRPFCPDVTPIPDESLDVPTGDRETDMDRRITLRQGFVRISSGCRKLLAARYIEGRSLKETADRMTLAHSGITKAIARCLKRLRACLT